MKSKLVELNDGLTEIKVSSNICRICKRRLTDSTSVSLGIGPVCRAKDIFDSKQGELFMFEAIPNFGDVTCSRDCEGIHTNVPHRIKRHSPTGLAWGYGGSGPADFALNILSVFIGQKEYEKDELVAFYGN
jgi:hypothetical protein